MQTVTLDAYAKINLTLDVTGQRADGYHLVRMVMQSVSLYDTLTLSLRADAQNVLHLSDASTAEGAKELPLDATNLILRAVDAMQKKYSITYGIDVTLIKRIPMAAGLAGGSADAAAALVGMNHLFSLNLPAEELSEIALSLGADVPFCLTGGTKLAEGVGEILTDIPPMPESHILIAKPPVGVSTREVYTALDRKASGSYAAIAHPDVDGQIAALKRADLNGVSRLMGNVLETVTLMTTPAVGRIKDMMRTEGALGAMMTGSGPTVFGIFTDKGKADRAYDALLMSGLCADVCLCAPAREGIVIRA